MDVPNGVQSRGSIVICVFGIVVVLFDWDGKANT